MLYHQRDKYEGKWLDDYYRNFDEQITKDLENKEANISKEYEKVKDEWSLQMETYLKVVGETERWKDVASY